jgi:hypothetical protein
MSIQFDMGLSLASRSDMPTNIRSLTPNLTLHANSGNYLIATDPPLLSPEWLGSYLPLGPQGQRHSLPSLESGSSY